WVAQTVDRLASTGISDLVTSLALDPDGHPQIAYADASVLQPAPLTWARWSAGHWLTQTVTLSSTLPVSGVAPSLAIDSGGLPGIAYLDVHNFPTTSLAYANFDGAQWHVAAALGAADKAPSLVMQYPALPRIAAPSQNTLAYAAWNGASWATQVITPAETT